MNAGQLDGQDQGGPSEREVEWATPPRTGGREIRIGAFVLLGAFSFLMVLFLLTDPATFRGRYMVATEVPDASGIRRGDPVQMRGVNIGRVHQFDMIDQGVQITLEVDGRWSIPEDSRARLAGADLLGGRTVEVLPGVSDVPLSAGQNIPGESASGIMDMADTLGDDAQDMMRRIRDLLDETTVRSVQGSASELETLLQTLSTVTEEQRVALAQLSGSLARAAERVEDLTEREELDRSIARVDSTMVTLQAAGGSLSRASSSLEEILNRMEEGEGTLGRLSTDDALYRSLTETLDEIQLLVQDVRENPGRYIRLRIF